MNMAPPWSIGDAISNGLERFKDNIGLLIGAMVLVGFGSGLINAPSSVIQGVGQGLMSEMDSDQQAVVGIVIMLSQVFFGLLGFLVQTYLGLGMIRILLNIVRGEEASFGDFKSSGGVFLSALGATILATLGASVGVGLCIVPGVIVGLGLWFNQYVVVDQQLGAIDALKESWRLTEGNKVQLFLFALTSSLLMLAGLLACGVGIFVAAPVIGLATATVYHSLIEQKGTAQQPLV